MWHFDNKQFPRVNQHWKKGNGQSESVNGTQGTIIQIPESENNDYKQIGSICVMT